MIRNIYILLLLSLSISIVLGGYDVGDTISVAHQNMEVGFCYPSDSTNTTFSFSKHQGKVFMVIFSASWDAPSYSAIPEVDEIYQHWANDNRVEIVYFLDDIGQPYGCNQWGDAGSNGIPPIVDDGISNDIFNLFENPNGSEMYPLVVFFDYTMTVAHIMNSSPSFNVANAIIGNLLEGLPDNEIYGCTDELASNYNPDANLDDGSCEYLDIEATLSFGEVDIESQTIAIHLENSAPVSGFQFLLSSADSVGFVDAYGGSAEENGFTVELGGNNIVLGFSLSATEIPMGNDILTYIEFDGYSQAEICLSEGVITSGYEDAQYLDVSYGDCISLYSKGDVNMDGVLDVLDVVTIVNIIFETIDPDEYEVWASDYNSDGEINIMDIVQIINAIFADDIISNELIDSWMLTALTGTYTYVIDLPEDGYGQTWAADTSFGIRIKWNYADAILGANAETAQFWMPGAEFAVGDVSLYTVSPFDLATLQAAQIGLIGVFEDAPSSGADATYKMKGTYPGIFYNYSLCSSAGSTAPMTDQGLYTWDQTSYNFTIKRDPSISGSQVLPPFDDGTLVLPTDTTMNMQFTDRDSHSTLYAEIMDSWDEGNHPDPANGGNGENSGGDRTYMAFPPLTVDENGAFAGTYDGTAGTTPATSGYYMSLELTSWGGYMTWYAFSFLIESEYLGAMAAAGAITIADADADGAITSVDIAVYIMLNPTNTTQTGMPYSVIVSAGTNGPVITNDSDHDVDVTGGATTLGAGGKLTFDVIRDCAAPLDVIIDYNLTFKRCVTDNCTGDGYHVTPTWD